MLLTDYFPFFFLSELRKIFTVFLSVIHLRFLLLAVVVLIMTIYRLKYETENNQLLKFFMWWNERKKRTIGDDLLKQARSPAGPKISIIEI